MTHKYLMNNKLVKLLVFNNYKSAYKYWEEDTGPRGGKIRHYPSQGSVPKHIVHVSEHPRTLWDYTLIILPKTIDLSFQLSIHKKIKYSLEVGIFKRYIMISV